MNQQSFGSSVPDTPVFANNIIYSFMVQYNRLTDIINMNYGNSPATQINFFIDLNSIFSRLYRTSNLKFNTDSTLVGNILSLCSHYRHFFRSRYNVESNIYIIDSNNCPEVSSKIQYGYNKNYRDNIIHNTFLTSKLDETRKILRDITLYIPNVMYIGSDEETGVIIKEIIEFSNPNIPNLILTKDIYNYQLVDDNTFILRPYKKLSDGSYIINPSNVMTYVLLNRGIKSEDAIATYSDIPYKLLSTIFAFTRMPERKINSLINVPIFVDQLRKIIDLNLINYYSIFTNIESIYSILRNNTKIVDDIPIKLIESRFRVIDIDYQYMMYIKSTKNKMYGFRGMQSNFGSSDVLIRLCEQYLTSEETNMVMNL